MYSRALAAKVNKLRFHYGEIAKLLKGERIFWRKLTVPSPDIYWAVPKPVLKARRHPDLAYISKHIEYNTKTKNNGIQWVKAFDHKRKVSLISEPALKRRRTNSQFKSHVNYDSDDECFSTATIPVTTAFSPSSDVESTDRSLLQGPEGDSLDLSCNNLSY